MTKRVVIAAVLMAVALVASLSAERYVHRNTEQLISYLEKAEELKFSGNDYEEPLDEAIKLWREKTAMFGVLLKHEDTDAIDVYFNKITKYRQTGDTDELFGAVEDCRAALIVVLEGEQPNMRNIF